jgi:hypothetical protein
MGAAAKGKQMKLITILLAGFLGFISLPGSAETTDQLGKALIIIEHNNRGCDVSLEYYGHISERGSQAGSSPRAAVLVYSVASCGGGNSWAEEISVQQVLGNKLESMSGLAESSFAGTESVSFAGDNVTFELDTYSDDDPRCCPSIRRTAKVTFKGNIASISFSNEHRLQQ